MRAKRPKSAAAPREANTHADFGPHRGVEDRARSGRQRENIAGKRPSHLTNGWLKKPPPPSFGRSRISCLDHPPPRPLMLGRRVLAFSPVFVLTLLLAGAEASAQDFEAEYAGLIAEFASSLQDTTAAESLADRADALYDRIRQHRRDNRDELSREERDRLGDLSGEVRSFRAATRVVGQLHNAADMDIESFDRVRERLGLEPRVLQTEDSGVELVRIDVGSFSSILLRNPTKTTFTMTYGVNDPESPGGVGSAVCEKYSVMSGLFNSRDREIEGLEFIINARPMRAAGCD